MAARRSAAQQPAARRSTAPPRHEEAVAAYLAAGGDESVQRVLAAVYGATKRLDQWYTRRFSTLGLTHGEWAVLAALARSHESPVTPSQLAELTGVGASSMTHRLDRMTARGLLERSRNPANRTRTEVWLTPAGWDLFGRASREAGLDEGDTLSGLSAEERAELGRLLEVVVSGLDGGPR